MTKKLSVVAACLVAMGGCHGGRTSPTQRTLGRHDAPDDLDCSGSPDGVDDWPSRNLRVIA